MKLRKNGRRVSFKKKELGKWESVPSQRSGEVCFHKNETERQEDYQESTEPDTRMLVWWEWERLGVAAGGVTKEARRDPAAAASRERKERTRSLTGPRQ